MAKFSLLTAAVLLVATTLAQSLPKTFKWTSSGPLISARNDGRQIDGIKDPSIIFINNTYHVFASTASGAHGYSLVYLSFTDFAKANSSTFHYLDKTPIGTGYRAAPEVFYFAPQKLWYLIYQNGNSAYSTNKDVSNPNGWSAPTNFYNGTPAIITANIGSGYWVDMFVICDDTHCYLFSSDDNGHLYRSSTTLANFPHGMSAPVIAKEASRFDLYEASLVYKVGKSQYILIVECIGAAGLRYFRSWTSSSLAGDFSQELAATEANPFAGMNDVGFAGKAWSKDISHGEVVRTMVDQTLTIDPCDIRFLYQGKDPASKASYNALPWQLGLITQTNKGAGCS